MFTFQNATIVGSAAILGWFAHDIAPWVQALF